MKKALILEAWYSKPEDSWYPWLRAELVKGGYEVYVPDLPTIRTNLPDLAKILKYLDKHITIDKDTIILGHSLGCLVALRLAEKLKFKKMFLVAGWDFNDLTEEHRLFWKSPIDHNKIKHNVEEIYCISSDNDPYVTAITAEDMAKRLGGRFLLIKGKKHFSEKLGGVKKIPELLKHL